MANIPIDFILFACTLLCVALFQRHTLAVSLCGLFSIAAYKLGWGDFAGVAGWQGLVQLWWREWVSLANLLALLLGFTLLADHFERSQVPALLPRYLPNDWKGGLVLLLVVFVLSAFLDNIAAAMIGGSTAAVLYQRRVHVGYLAALVAASNAGGAGSVVGDTTTSMLWMGGVAPVQVLKAYVAAVPALLVFGVVAAKQQQRYQAIIKDNPVGVQVQWGHLVAVLVIVLSALLANVCVKIYWPDVLLAWPVIGMAVWAAIALSTVWCQPHWRVLPNALRGSVFLLSLVMCAAMMPVQHLPAAGWFHTLALGFFSAVFDNIPLTALALHQGGYDWGFLAYAVGFGGSMLWFGSSAGVALGGMYPQAKSVVQWLKHGWHVVVGYLVGFAVLMWVGGWQAA